MSCAHCNDTGSLSKDLLGYLDCTHCGVALECATFENWLRTHHPYVQLVAAWLIYQHGKAAAIPPCYRLVPVNPAAP